MKNPYSIMGMSFLLMPLLFACVEEREEPKSPADVAAETQGTSWEETVNLSAAQMQSKSLEQLWQLGVEVFEWEARLPEGLGREALLEKLHKANCESYWNNYVIQLLSSEHGSGR